MSCKTIYVMISSFLSEEEKMIVAAHELGHIILHRSQLKMAPMQDDTLYNMTDNTEYQANLFAADLLIEPDEYQQFVRGNMFTLTKIREFADLIDRDPGIVLGRLQKDGLVRYDDWELNSLRHKYKVKIS